ncbi:protein of unknown function [Candidatus Filomicrobium marinum]|uniref:Uncharacterized protein n=1 Tax=Candidatus Filomicrobium marinum TaxID=1608628 RepID=A0A0D6JCZ2_9HYPH|nr:protein of unknown function [Candidatus Filomicrobium marinum]CPR16626.1 protein of unknown function [Candidatus Filomicrobium marinum]
MSPDSEARPVGLRFGPGPLIGSGTRIYTAQVSIVTTSVRRFRSLAAMDKLSFNFGEEASCPEHQPIRTTRTTCLAAAGCALQSWARTMGLCQSHR